MPHFLRCGDHSKFDPTTLDKSRFSSSFVPPKSEFLASKGILDISGAIMKSCISYAGCGRDDCA